jgi:hypothetical protein
LVKSSYVPTDLIEKACANFAVGPKAADANADARVGAAPAQRHEDDPRLEILRRPGIDDHALGMRPFMVYRHFHFGQGVEHRHARPLKIDPISAAPQSVVFVIGIGRLMRV